MKRTDSAFCDENRQEKTILCYGDSNTFGYDPCDPLSGRYPEQCRWVDILSELTGQSLVNRGQNGRQIPNRPGEWEQAERMLHANAPVDLLVVMLGTNDLLQGCTPEQAGDRMAAFLRHIRPVCRKLFLVAPPAMTRGSWVATDALAASSRQLGGIYRELARELGVAFADGEDFGVAIAHDGVHFTQAGHRAFAEGLYQAWKEEALWPGI